MSESKNEENPTEGIHSLEDDTVAINEFRWYHNPQNWVRIVITSLLIAFVIFACIRPTFSIDMLTFFLNWIMDNPWEGSIVFILAQVIGNLLMIPGIILSLGAGIIYVRCIGFWPGILFGSFVLLVSVFIGSCAAFLNARFLLRNAFVYLIRNHRKFQLIDQAVQRHGFKVVFLFRISPVTPYSFFNYIMGFSSVTFGDYCLGSFGMIPNIFAYVYLGATINNIYEIATLNPENSRYMLIITIVGLVILAFTIGYIAYIARTELRRISKRLSQENNAAFASDVEHTPLNLGDDDLWN